MDFGTRRSRTATGFVNMSVIGGILGGYLPGVITTEHDWTAMFKVFLVGRSHRQLSWSPMAKAARGLVDRKPPRILT
jgi:sugar phosphate permease